MKSQEPLMLRHRLPFKTILLFAFLLIFSGLRSQISSTGKLFYMSFMEMEARTGGFPDSLLLYITSEKNTTVVLDNPRLGGSAQTINITAGVVNRRAVDPTFYYPVGSEFPSTDLNSRRGLRITAKDPVNVYCMNLEQNRSDGTFVMPYEAIPRAPQFYVAAFTPTQRSGGFGTGPFMPSQAVIIAMDNVTVEITPTVRTKLGKPAGVPFTVSMVRGQVYQLQSNDADGSTSNGQSLTGDLTGTRIRVINGCGKINVFCGMKSVRIPDQSCGPAVDHLYTQLFPTSVLGRRHVVMPYRNQTKGYVVKVLATKPNTRISVDGTYIGSTRNAGQYYYLDQTTSVARCITSDSPIYVVQYMKNGGTCAGTTGNLGDPAILIMPDQSQKMLKTIVGTATTSNMNNHFVNVLVSTSAKKLVKLNGTLLNSSVFVDVPCAGQSYAQLSVANPSSNVLECDSGLIAVAYGVGQYESYSYCSGALFENLDYDFTITRSSKCPKVPVNLSARLPKSVNPSRIIWDFGDNTPTDTGRNVSHAFLRTGAFYVTMKAVVAVPCGANDTFTRSKIIDILPGPTLNFPDTIIKCGNGKINELFDAGSSVKFLYRWQDSSNKRFFTATNPGKIWVRVRDTSTNCVSFDSTQIVRAPQIDARIKLDTALNCFNVNRYVISDNTNYFGDSRKSVLWKLANPYVAGDTTRLTNFIFRKKFDTTGNFYLEYIVYTNKGCSDTVKTTLKVNGMPKAKLWSRKSFYCQSELANLRDSSSGDGGIGKTFWNFGNGKRDTVTNRLGNITYTNFDTFGVNMITETIHGCRDTLDSAFVVHPKPVSSITKTTNNQCFKQNSFTFTDNSAPLPYGTYNRYWSYNRTFKVGSVSLNPVNFVDTGFWTVTRIDTSNFGCMDSVKTTVYVAPEPRARIAVTDSNKCFNQHFFNLDDRSVIGSGSVASRKWSFSDGTSSTSKTLNKKKFTAWGVYTAKLVVTSGLGCKDSVNRLLDVSPSPMSAFSVNKNIQCLIGNSFSFSPNNILNVPGISVSHKWDFGDNSTSNSASPVMSYGDTGTYKVVYIMSTSLACSDTTTQNMRVEPTPKPTFTNVPDSTCLGKTKFDFTNTTSFNGPLTYNWSLGDGAKATTKDVVQKDYASAGNYTVKLIVTSLAGCKDSITRLVKVFPIPQASFTINDDLQCLNGNNFIITDNSNTNGATGVSYSWTMTPGGTFTGKNYPNQIFTDTGNYSLKLDVLSDRGCGTSMTKTMYVAETPYVNVTFDPDACQGESVSFASTTLINKGFIAGYSWNFGDGSNASVANPSKVYNTSGNFNVSLTVTSSNGCTATSTAKPMTIFAKPVANFTSEYLLSRGMETDWKFVFTGSNAAGYDWRFEDGQNSNSGGPLFLTFNDTGNFRVKLIVTSPDFCIDSVSRNIFLKPELLLWLPTSFTPNNDGLNETFGPNTTFGLSKYNMKIYDRWGGLIFTTNDPAKSWNGTDAKGDPLPEGVYAYTINFRYIDGKLFVYKGSVTILR
ncbi:MAG: PKD domain-containing protein [Sphingomonadales bacterium]|jgi:gliding motility-associated-like protein